MMPDVPPGRTGCPRMSADGVTLKVVARWRACGGESVGVGSG